MANTPAIVVVLTAPRPTSSTPNRPRAGAISTEVDTGRNYITWGSAPNPGSDARGAPPPRAAPSQARRARQDESTPWRGACICGASGKLGKLHVAMLMNPFRRREDPYLLVVGMSGVKMGDRLLQV